MKRFLFLILLTIFQVELSADIITLTVTVTNAPSAGNYLTINADSRTNKSSVAVPAKEVLVGATIGAATTNWFNHSATYAYTGLLPRWIGTNSYSLRASEGLTITATASGTWCTLTLSTQSTTQLIPVRIPISGEPSTAIKTNIASQLIKGIFNDGFANNTVAASSAAMAHFVDDAENQTIDGVKTFTTEIVSGTKITSSAGGVVDLFGTSTNSEFLTFAVNAESDKRVVFLPDGRIYGGLGSATPEELWQFTPTARTNKVATLADTTNALTGFIASPHTWTGVQTFGPISSTHLYDTVLSNATMNVATDGSLPFKVAGTKRGEVSWNATDFVVAGDVGTTGASLHLSGNGDWSIGSEDGMTANERIDFTLSTGLLSLDGTSIELKDNTRIGTATFPASRVGGFLLSNGTAPSADPSGSAVQWSSAGEWKYRSATASEGAGQENRVHNRTIYVNGAGTDFTVPDTAYNRLDFGTTDVEAVLPTAGTYTITALVSVVNGGTANDVYHVKFYNSTDAADAGGSSTVSSCNASQTFQMNMMAVVTVTAAKTIQVYFQNATAARGTVDSDETRIIAVRQY